MLGFGIDRGGFLFGMGVRFGYGNCEEVIEVISISFKELVG